MHMNARNWKWPRALLAAPLLATLGGCGMVVMDPSGDVARQEADLVLWSVWLMLLIIVPVMILTASGQESDEARARASNVSLLRMKPFSSRELRADITRLLSE